MVAETLDPREGLGAEFSSMLSLKMLGLSSANPPIFLIKEAFVSLYSDMIFSNDFFFWKEKHTK